jgi:hypothetical protein
MQTYPSTLLLGGRPKKRTPKNAQIICECLAHGSPYVFAATAAGMNVQTLRSWIKEDEQFRTRTELAIAAGVNARLKKIEEASKDDWRAASWLLEHCQPEFFAKSRVQVEAVGQFDHAFVIPQETLNQIAEARAKHDRERNGGPAALSEPQAESQPQQSQPEPAPTNEPPGP